MYFKETSQTKTSNDSGAGIAIFGLYVGASPKWWEIRARLVAY